VDTGVARDDVDDREAREDLQQRGREASADHSWTGYIHNCQRIYIVYIDTYIYIYIYTYIYIYIYIYIFIMIENI